MMNKTLLFILVTVMVPILCGVALADQKLELQVENQPNGAFIGAMPLLQDSAYYIQKVEFKAKREEGTFFSPQEALGWLDDVSSFSTLDWTGTTIIGNWNGDGTAYTADLGAPWRGDTYTVTIQGYNAGGDVGTPLVANWNDYGKKEAKAEYKAENCSVAYDSTSAGVLKTEGKLKLENPLNPVGIVIPADADSMRITVAGALSGEVLEYKAVINWTNPALFGLNIDVSVSEPQNGLYYAAAETLTATIVFTNDNGDTLAVDNGANNKLEKFDLWVSGPRQAYENLSGFAGLKIIDKYAFKPESGFDPATNTIKIGMPADLSGIEGTYTLMPRAKRKGFGPEIEKALIFDVQVGTETVTTTPSLTWATTCNDCHQLEKHKFTSMDYCVVCHADNFGKALREIIHEKHISKDIYTCETCHTGSEGNDEALTATCVSCHDGNHVDALPVWHATFTDEMCAYSGCHSTDSDAAPDYVHHSAFYVGKDRCQNCHNDPEGMNQYEGWSQTLHAVAWDSVSYVQTNAYCLGCHTTGWDPSTDNGGYDDFFNTGDQAGMDRMKNVQCEACHDPGPHPDKTFAADDCGACHQGDHHPTWTDWQISKHAVSKATSIPGFDFIASNPSCSGCHTAEGFLQFAEQAELEPDVIPPGNDGSDLTCAACHDPHADDNEHQLRLPVTEICVKCHNPEYNPDNPVADGSAIHHSTAYMFEGNGGYEYEGYVYDSSLHTLVITEKCVTCHVFTTEYQEGPPTIPAYTGHSFEPQYGACAGCHGDFVPADSSFDYRGTQSYIDSLAAVLFDRLVMATSDDSTTDAFYRAKFNYDFVQADGSHGIHNTKYAEDLLLSALQHFDPTGVETVDKTAPLNYELSQNYPNPFNPVTTIKFAVRQAGHVSIKIYDLLGREVYSLVDKEMKAGRYKTQFAGSNLASGIYIYRIQANDFTAVRKMVLLK